MPLENIGCKHNGGKRFFMSVKAVKCRQNVFLLTSVDNQFPVAFPVAEKVGTEEEKQKNGAKRWKLRGFFLHLPRFLAW